MVVVVEEEVDGRDEVADLVHHHPGPVLARGVVPAQGAAQSRRAAGPSHGIVRDPSPSLSRRTRALGPDLDPSEFRIF